jgi:uncharacterized surface protein with fasciclin (FAS1) repeats
MRTLVPLIAGVAVLLSVTLGCERYRPDETDQQEDQQEATREAEEEPGTIVDVASQNDSFETLVTAIEAADLTETLEGDGPYTVFAPTDEAFDELPEGKLDSLLEARNKKKLRSILTYHVVSDQLYAEDVEPGEVETVEGSMVTIEVTDEGDVMYGNAKVVETDVEASNGVIHAIDTVVMPPGMETAMK